MVDERFLFSDRRVRRRRHVAWRRADRGSVDRIGVKLDIEAYRQIDTNVNG